MKFISAMILLVWVAGFSMAAHPTYPATSAELDSLKTLPKGFALWGIGINTLGQVLDGDTVDYGDGIYKTSLGDTTAILLDSLGHQPNIHPTDSTLIAYFAQTTKAVDCTTSDVWLMDIGGQHKRKITKQPLKNITALHWSSPTKLIIAYGRIACPDCTNDSVYLMDTATGSTTVINTGLNWQSGSCTGYDGVACVGDRITFRAVAGWNTSGGVYGVVLASINQNHPEVLLQYMVNVGMCGENLSTDAPQPSFMAINSAGHDAFQFYSARDGSHLYDKKFWMPMGWNFHNFTWARNNLNWACAITRSGTVYPYIIDLVNQRMIRMGFGKQGSYHPDLFISKGSTDVKKNSFRIAPSSNTNRPYEVANIRGQIICQGQLPGIASRHTMSPGVYLVRQDKGAKAPAAHMIKKAFY